MPSTIMPKSVLTHDDQFPARLRARRHHFGLGQMDLAAKAGLKPNAFRTIQRWEAGLSSPRPGGDIIPIAKALKVSVAWLLLGKED